MELSRSLLQSRIAVFYYFILEGVLVGVFSDFNPYFENKLQVNDSKYGLSLLFFYLGTVLATFAASMLLRRYGSRRSTFIGALIFGISMPLVAYSKNIIVFTLSLFLFGYFQGIMDVSMNSCGVLTEVVSSKPLLGGYHGSYSIGAALGNLIGNTLQSKMSLSPLTIFCIFGFTSTILSFLAYNAMFSFTFEKTLKNSINNNNNNITENHNIARNKEYESISSLDDSLIQENTPNAESNNDNKNNNNNEKTILEYFKLSFPEGTKALSLIGFIASFGESSVGIIKFIYSSSLLS